jgi:hypothetical protein
MTSRCPRYSAWNIETHTLEGVGLVENATDCELATVGLRTIPELHGAARYAVEMPLVIPPMDIPVIEAHEIPEVEAALTSAIRELESVRSNVLASRKTMEIDTLLHVSNRLPSQEAPLHWYETAAIAVGTTLVIVVVYMTIRRAPRCFAKRHPEERTKDQEAIPLQELTTNTVNTEKKQESTVYTYAVTG